jgi:ADP-ribose pyrophosphatase YjhB (NUDIX family)
MDYANAKPAAGALVERDGRLLVVRRAIDPWVGRWDIPGGYCEECEHPIAAAEREVAEETGLAVEVTGFLGVWLDCEADETTLNLFYHARVLGSAGTVPSPEVSEVAWRDPGSLTPQAVAFPALHAQVLRGWCTWRDAGRSLTAPLDRPVPRG